ncbi:MAG: hypothetical protein WEB19_05120 [Acidimicrobiia bacterium]
MTDSARETAHAKLQGWFAGRIPADWFTGAPDVTHDRDEIVVIGSLAEPKVEAGTGADARRASARQGRIQGFREDTRQLRMRIADEAEARFGRKVAWGVRCGDSEEVFTNLSVPVMTRLRLPERRVLDTLVDAGVARSRSHALAWCVRLVGNHEGDWITQLRDALVHVEKVRSEGPERE